ncbi:hypothetical protein Tco_1030724 [Tanacetum coccineum]|uniref:Uncharacterized protein n=1 Tax=Tanacetum coccineum TaxID=301880 RepID=A0ABQ5G8M6_9ASTR
MLIRSFTSPISNSSDTSDVFPQRPPPSFLLIQHPFVVIKRYSSWKEERGEKYRWPPGRGESEMLILDYLSSPVLYAVTIARTLSSSHHPLPIWKDAFSSNFLNYLPPASLDYIPTSLGKTYSSSSNSFGIVPLASPTLSLFHDDPYMKALQAFYTEKLPILPPTIIPPSSILNPQEFLSPKKQAVQISFKPLPNLKTLRYVEKLTKDKYRAS